MIFSLINYARFLQVDAENALEKTNKKFIHRFTKMEEEALQSGKSLSDMTLLFYSISCMRTVHLLHRK